MRVYVLRGLNLVSSDSNGRIDAFFDISGRRRSQLVIPSGGNPLDMMHPGFWPSIFYSLWHFGDAVFGLTREVPLPFAEWAAHTLQSMVISESHDADSLTSCIVASIWCAYVVEKRMMGKVEFIAQ